MLKSTNSPANVYSYEKGFYVEILNNKNTGLYEAYLFHDTTAPIKELILAAKTDEVSEYELLTMIEDTLKTEPCIPCYICEYLLDDDDEGVMDI